MAPRVQVQSGLGRLRLQPTARPVDSFQQTTEGRDLVQLGDALTQVAPELGNLGDLLTKRKGERDRAAGQQEARELYESGKSWREAISKGLITADKSPWFRQGAEEQMGKLAAENFHSDMTLAFANSEYVDSYEPKDFDKFSHEYMQKWAGENLPEGRSQAFNTGFAQVDDYIAGARQQFAERAGENLIKYNRESFGAAVFSSLRRITEAKGSMADMATSVQQALDLQVAAGLSPRIANNIAAEAVIRMADTTTNPAYLDILKMVKAGKQTLYDRPTVGEAVKKANEDIYSRQMQQVRAEKERKAEANRLATNTVMATAIAKLQADPANANLEPFIEQLRSLDSPESTVSSLANLKRTMAGEKFAGDQGITNELLGNVVTVTDLNDPDYVTRTTAMNALNARRINQDDFNNIMSYITQRDREDSGEGNKILRDPTFTEFRSLLKAQFGSELAMPAENRAAMYRAVGEFTNEWLRYKQGNGSGTGDVENVKFLTGLIEAKRTKYGGLLSDIKASFTQNLPIPDLNAQPAWKQGPLPNFKREDWLSISRDYVRGGMSIDSLSNDQIQRMQAAGATPETLSEFLKLQLQFNGIQPTQPAAAKR